jgi:myo-inositol 2-dehydrogenase/D-chiro-inositol 1-dehydrogenase
MGKQFGIALLGLGRAGSFHRSSLRQSENANLITVFDIDPIIAQQVAQKEGCLAAPSAEDAISNPAVDAVIVATPTDTHYDYVTQALESGKAVFSEKPLGQRLEQLDHCYAMADQKDLPLFAAFNRRFDPSFASLVGQVHAGGIGDLRFVRTVSRDSPLPSMDYLRISCGIFHDCVVHDLDMVCHIVGETPTHVSAFASAMIPDIKEMDDFDNVVATLKFPSGVVASIDVNRDSVVGYDQRVEAFGSAGMLQADNWHNTSVTHATPSGFSRPLIDHSFPTRYREAYTIELDSFIECLQGKHPAPIIHQEVRTNHLLACGLEIAAREKRVVAFDEIENIVHNEESETN